MTSLKNKFIGDKAFYKALFSLALPLIVQQGITNFVNLLDNVMVGSLGTASISAVAIVNQLIFIFNLTIFGGVSGASIFGAQFAGKGDMKGLRETFRFKIMYGLVAAISAITIFSLFSDNLLMLFLTSDVSDPVQVAITLEEGKQYLTIMLFSLIPFMLVQSYAGTLRETGETLAPMIGGVIAILVNLVLNYILIFGNFGAPELGVVGAAIGTCASRYVEFIFIAIFTHRNAFKFSFIIGAYKSIHVSKKLLRDIAVTGSPLIINEVLWSIGMTTINQSYSVRGLNVVASINITSTVWNLFCIIMFAIGSTISIMVGQHLGAGNIEKAKDTNNKLHFAGLAMNVCIGAILFFVAPYIPLLYQTEEEVRILTTNLLRVAAFSLPIHTLIHNIYFTLRSGGKTFITFIFDCVYTWVIPVPLSIILARYTNLDVIWVYASVQMIDVVKICIGVPLVRSGIWVNNLVSKIKND